MKKKIIMVIIIIAVLGMIGFLLYSQDNLKFKISYEYINHVEYANGKKIKVKIPFQNPIVYLNKNEIISFLEKKTGIVYFGYNTCPWCRNIIEPLLEVAKEEKIEHIYYVDIHKNLKDISKELTKVLDDYLTLDEETNEKRIAVPDVYFVKEGKIVFHHLGTVESYKNPYLGMNNQQIRELKSIYRKGIEAMNS